MFLSRLRLCPLVLLVTLIGNSVRADDPLDRVDEKLLEKLQGVWDPVSSIFDGSKNEIDLTKKLSFVIAGRTMSIRFEDQVIGSVEIKHLVAKESLGHIDFEMKDAAGETVRGRQLFKLEGDKLTTCIRSPAGDDRPSALESTVGSKYLLTVSKRRKDTP